MLGIKKAIEAAENMPEDVRRNLLGLLDDIEKGDLAEKIGEDLGRGLVKGVLSGLNLRRVGER